MIPELHNEWPLWCDPPLRVEAIRVKGRQDTQLPRGSHPESSRLQEKRRTARVRRGGSEGSPTLLAVFPGYTLTLPVGSTFLCWQVQCSG